MTTPMKNALVIQAIGTDGSDTRRRADRVLQSIIQPACKATGYEAIRSEQLSTNTIFEPIVSALNTYPLVVADLAAPPWDPNVLTEIGFRLASGRPILFLADTDPTPECVPLQLRNVRIHIINSANPIKQDVANLVESIKRYGPKVNYWESDHPTIEFSISWNSPEGGRFIFANERAAKVYGLTQPEELIGRPVNEIDPKLRQFMPKGHYDEYDRDQNAILGKIVKRVSGPKTAEVPLWFIEHTYRDEKDQIYWPVIVQYRYVSSEEGADIVMRVIFINIKDWDAMSPPPRQPPQVLKVPALFRDVRRPPSFTHDVFLSYNSHDIEYVSGLYQMLIRCGLTVWFDANEFGGGKGLALELIRASNRSRIFACVLGPRGLGQWQEQNELKLQLQNIIRGQKPFVLLLLPEVAPGDSAWRACLNDPDLETVFADRLRVALPSPEELSNIMQLGRPLIFRDRLLKLILQVLRTLEER
jgi:hypothetical protein